MMKLRINPIVAEDLKNIREYIAEDNEEMAVKTIQEIYARIENIQQFPYMGADLAKRVCFRTDYKYLICGNYVVIYKIREEYVEIYRELNYSDSDLPETTKSGKGHGIGLNNISRVAKIYMGDISLEQVDKEVKSRKNQEYNHSQMILRIFSKKER